MDTSRLWFRQRNLTDRTARSTTVLVGPDPRSVPTCTRPSPRSLSPLPALSLVVAIAIGGVLHIPAIRAAGYVNGLAPPGVPAGSFPPPARPVAGIVTDIWRD